LVLKSLKKAFIFALKVCVAAGLLWWLWESGKLEPDKIAAALKSHPFWIVVAFGIYNICIFLTATRWRMLLRSQDIRPPWADCVQMTYIGCFFSCFLPGGTGGDFVKAYYVARDSKHRAEAVTTVFLDRVLGLYCMVGLASVALLFHVRDLWKHPGPAVAVGLTATQLLVVGVLSGFTLATLGLAVLLSSHSRRLVHFVLGHLPERIADILRRVYEAVYLYRGQKMVLVKFALYSVTAHGLAAVALWIVGISLADPVAHGGARALNYFFLVPLGLVINGLPLTPGGIGAFEWALGLLFGTVIHTGETNVGSTVAALGHIIFILTNQVGIIFYIKGKKRVEEAIHDAEAAGEAGPET
jgi:uncharacterized protein (TIRG00374 family)